MKYQVDIPSEVNEQLTACASRTGADVVQLIQQAVVHFVYRYGTRESPGKSDWSQEADDRRCHLIDRDIADTIDDSERDELSRLQRLANEHFDHVAPPPINGARQLHQQLLNRSASK